MERAPDSRIRNILLIAGIVLLTIILFRAPLTAVFSLAWNDDRYLQISLAPFLCLFLLYWERAAIFPQARFSPRIGIVLTSVAMLAGLAAMYSEWPGGAGANLAPVLFAIVLTWISAFILCYGLQSLRKAAFGLCCLFLMIPVSSTGLEWMTAQLQQGSASTSFQILRLLGIPVYREGMTFLLPGLAFRVAPECSGIHSWLAFVVMAIVTARIFLRSPWRIAVLIASTIPIAIFKNAVRIVVIAGLTAYVDPAIITSPLHRRGGPLFALIDMAVFVPLLIVMQRWEVRRRSSAVARTPAEPGADCVVNAAR